MDLSHEEKGKYGRKFLAQFMSTCGESLFYRDYTQQKQHFVSKTFEGMYCVRVSLRVTTSKPSVDICGREFLLSV